MAKDYYDILGIQKSASQEEVKKAFHRLAHKHHPNKGGDEKKFKEINEAYQILSNQEKRSQYDQFGQVFEGGMPGGQGGQGFDPNWFWANSRAQQGANVEFDLGDLGDIFGDFFGGSRQGRRTTKDIKKGSDIKIELDIPLEETLREARKVFSLKKQTFCSRCGGVGAEPGTKINECVSCRGIGQVQQIRRTILGSFTQTAVCPECAGEGQRPEKPCNVCKGEGRTKGEEDIEVIIPAGIDAGQVIKVANKGNSGRRGGRAGDLYVRISITPNPIFTRQGDDIYTNSRINLTQAVLGAKIDIQTLSKTKIELTIPAGIESGKVFRISGKGIPHFNGGGTGDMYVEITVKLPQKINRKQKELLEELKKEGL